MIDLVPLDARCTLLLVHSHLRKGCPHLCNESYMKRLTVSDAKYPGTVLRTYCYKYNYSLGAGG